MMPNVCHRTTSVFSILTSPSAIHSGKPLEGSPEVCGTCLPAGWISSSLSKKSFRISYNRSDGGERKGLSCISLHVRHVSQTQLSSIRLHRASVEGWAL